MGVCVPVVRGPLQRGEVLSLWLKSGHQTPLARLVNIDTVLKGNHDHPKLYDCAGVYGKGQGEGELPCKPICKQWRIVAPPWPQRVRLDTLSAFSR